MSAEGFAAVPNWMIRESTLTIYELAVYMALASHSGRGGIRPSIPTLAREARCSVRKVQDSLKVLEASGIVAVDRRRGANGAWLPSVYRLLPNGAAGDGAPGGGASDAPPLVQEVRQGGARGAGEEEPLKKSSRARRELATIPDFFGLTDEMRAWAAESTPAVDVELVTAAFIDYWRHGNGSGRRHRDWISTWRNWLRSEQAKAQRFGWRREAATDAVEADDVTARRHRAQRDAWLAARGVTLAEFEARRDEPGWIESLRAVAP